MTSTVTVACKMPHGLVCRLFRMVDNPEPLPGGGTKNVKRAMVQPELTFKLNGYLVPAKRDEPPPPAMPSAFALTHGVDKDLFDEWLKQNKDLDLVRAGLVFAYEDENETKAQVKDSKSLKCGLEPLDRSNLPKSFKGIKSYSKEDA